SPGPGAGTRRKYGLEVHVSADPLADSPRKDVRTLLFESVRELLFNVVKHAQVDRVAVELALDASGMLCISVADQGRGFDVVGLDEATKASHVGWGLFSIRERLTLLGGRFEIESAPGRGTRGRLIAPPGSAPGDVVAARPSNPGIAGPAVHDAGVASPHALRILIVDDHAAVREALRGFLQARSELQVVGDAANGLEAIAQAHA